MPEHSLLRTQQLNRPRGHRREASEAPRLHDQSGPDNWPCQCGDVRGYGIHPSLDIRLHSLFRRYGFLEHGCQDSYGAEVFFIDIGPYRVHPRVQGSEYRLPITLVDDGADIVLERHDFFQFGEVEGIPFVQPFREHVVREHQVVVGSHRMPEVDIGPDLALDHSLRELDSGFAVYVNREAVCLGFYEGCIELGKLTEVCEPTVGHLACGLAKCLFLVENRPVPD